MRILVHDRTGHPFQVQLSRELAKRGYQVLHLHDVLFQTPKGDLIKRSTDPTTFNVRGLNINRPFQKYSFVKRRFQEIAYGKLVATEISAFQPQTVISANTPPDAQAEILKRCRALNIKFISWVQDIHGLAISQLLIKKLSLLGYLIGQYYIRLERRLFKQSNDLVLITEDFQPLMVNWKIEKEKLHVIPNWAPLASMPSGPKSNTWAKMHQLDDKFCLLYAGTLGMKHNPDLLLQLAFHFKETDNVRIVIISEGLGANWLKEKKREWSLDHLLIMNFQPFERFPEVLASADVLLGILTAEAGIFSVPSKILSYLCARRPLLLAVPPENLAAKIVSENKAGLVTEADDSEAFVEAADILFKDQSFRDACANNALAYAQKNFEIKAIGDKFEAVILRS